MTRMVGDPRQRTVDEWFDLLANEHRRELLLDLLESDSRYIHPRCTDKPDRSWRDRGALYHVHLPKLAQANVIEWDQERGAIGRGSQYEDIRPLLELLTDDVDGIVALRGNPPR